MGLYSYSFQNKKRDLADIMSTVIKDEPRFISNFRRVEDAADRKHEWLEDQLSGRAVTVTAVEDDVCTVSANDLAKIRKGTLMVPAGDSALFQVTAVNAADFTFTASRVAANGSSTSAPAADMVMNIVSSPMAEASSNGDGEESYHLGGSEYNITQIFRKDIVLSGSALAVSLNGNADNQLNRQTAFALSELARDLNRHALFGRRVAATASTPGEAGGLYAFAAGSDGLAIDADGAMLDSFIVNDGAQAVLSEGGNPVQILCSPGQARVLSAEYRDRLQVLRSDDVRGSYVAVIINEINGRGMTIMADGDVPDGDAWVLDTAGFGIANLKGRSIMDEDATPGGFDGIKRMALGELTFVFRNARQRCCRIHGLMNSASAIAAGRD